MSDETVVPLAFKVFEHSAALIGRTPWEVSRDGELLRVATPIIEKNGGLITSSTNATTANGTWGKAFDWCDYGGMMDGQRVGVTLMPDPANFRPSWFHNRNYGLMAANPFGRKSMKQGAESRVEVKLHEKLRLRFGLLLHAAPPNGNPDIDAAYRDLVGQSRTSTP